MSTGPSHRKVEIGVAVATALFGILVMVGSWQVGVTWGVEGPRAGFFPFYVGLFITLASLVNLVQAFPAHAADKLFTEWSQLRSVMSVVIPTTVYVLIIPFIGIYVSSTLLMALFMKWLGRYRWGFVLLISIGVPIVIYVMFERWFLVSLPKGPLEDWLGL